MKRHLIAGIMLILSILIFYFFVIPSFRINQLLESIHDTDLLLYWIAISCLVFSNIFASFRWSLLLRRIHADTSLSFFHALGTFCFGQVAGLIVPSRVGNYTKIPLIKKLDNISTESCVSAVNAETVLDLGYICIAGFFSVLLLSMVFSAFFLTSALIIIFFILIGILVLLFYQSRSLQAWNARLESLSKDPDGNYVLRKSASGIKSLLDLIYSTRTILLDTEYLPRLGILTLITQLFGVLCMYWIIASVHLTVSLITVFAILTLTYIVGIISLIPGGFGASDLSLIVLLGTQGISAADATNITILWRVAMYLPVMIITLAYLLHSSAGTEFWQ